MRAPAERSEHPPEGDRFRHFAATAPIGVYETDAQGTVVFVNDRWRDITGVDEPVPVAVGALQHHLAPDEREPLLSALRAAHAAHEDFDVTSVVTAHDGSRRHIRIQGSPVREADGALRGFTGTVMDLTDLVQATRAAENSERRYRSLIETAPVGQAIYDARGRLLQVNQAWADLLGYGIEEVIGTAAADHVHPDDLPQVLVDGPRLLRGELDHLINERRLLRKDGTAVWVSTSVTIERDADGKPLFHSLVIDVNERHLAEEALRESEARYRKLIQAAPVPQIVTSYDGELVEFNTAYVQLMRSTPEEIWARDPFASIPPDERSALRDTIRALQPGETIFFEDESRLLRPDGSSVWVIGGTSLIDDGENKYLHTVIQDIDDRREIEDALRDSEARYRAVIESLHDGLIVHTQDSILAANASAARILGMDADTRLDARALARLPVIDREGHEIPLADRPSMVCFRTNDAVLDTVLGFKIPSGELRWCMTNAVPLVHQGADEPYAVALSFTDITEGIEAEERNARLAGIVETTSDLVGIVDWHSGMMVYLNQSARELFGYENKDITEVHHLELFADDAIDVVMTSLEAALRAGDTWSGELAMCAHDGSKVMVWQTIAAERSPEGDILQLAAVGRDVTERRRFEQRLAYEATHDAHTRLPNRSLLIDHLELALARSERDHHLVALMFLDLDRFKQVNDTHGHDAGDELLAQTARRLSRVLRPGDTVARIGGDEFVVLAEDIDDEDHAIVIARRIAAAIDSAPFLLREESFDVTASIGVALTRGGESHPEALLRDADAAMYRAKDMGRNRIELFDESMRQRVAQRNELADQLATGIEEDNIAVHYQPCVDLTTGAITGVEALARWQHPIRGILSPYEFIALAEDTGLIVGLGLAVLVKACQQAVAWYEQFGEASPIVHVNLSARQLTASNLPTLVEGVLTGTGLPAGKLCLEITESVLMHDAASVIDTLWALKGIGVSLAIDDFGTGYSSLSYLRRFPVDVLKVDQSFVDGLGPDPEDSAIVAAIVNLAATLELDAIAEGVETVEQLERLRALGCRSAQGFYFAKPQPPAEIAKLLETGFDI